MHSSHILVALQVYVSVKNGIPVYESGPVFILRYPDDIYQLFDIYLCPLSSNFVDISSSFTLSRCNEPNRYAWNFLESGCEAIFSLKEPVFVFDTVLWYVVVCCKQWSRIIFMNFYAFVDSKVWIYEYILLFKVFFYVRMPCFLH